MATAVGSSQTVTDTSMKTDPPPKSYKEAVSASAVSADPATKADLEKDVKLKPESETVKSKNTSSKEKNGQEKPPSDKDSEKEKGEKAPVRKFDSKLYVEAPPPKHNPWKKNNTEVSAVPLPQIVHTVSPAGRME